MRRILILGVNGFIGHHLSQRIITATDWEIYGMDMQTDRIADLLSEKRFHFFEGDITINRDRASSYGILPATIDNTLAGKTPLKDQRPSIGCNIKWKA